MNCLSMLQPEFEHLLSEKSCMGPETSGKSDLVQKLQLQDFIHLIFNKFDDLEVNRIMMQQYLRMNQYFSWDNLVEMMQR